MRAILFLMLRTIDLNGADLLAQDFSTCLTKIMCFLLRRDIQLLCLISKKHTPKIKRPGTMIPTAC